MRKIVFGLLLSIAMSFAGSKENIHDWVLAVADGNSAKALSLTAKGKEQFTKTMIAFFKAHPEKVAQAKAALVNSCSESGDQAICVVQFSKPSTYILKKEGTEFKIAGMK